MKRERPLLSEEDPTHRLWVYALVIAAMWTLVVAISLGSNLRQQRRETLEVARATARTAYQKDVIYRRWNAQHGGVYAPITEETQPNPYLKESTERPIEITAFSAKGPESGVVLTLTLINPAYMTRQVHELAAELHGVKGHITSLDPIRPANAPDAWEREALQSFEAGESEASEIQEIDGTSHMRLMQPLVTEESCLACHAEQGYELGDVRGGISVAVPMTELDVAAQKHNLVAWLGHGLLWIVGLTIIGGGGWALQGNVRKLQESEKQYRSLIRSIQAAVIVHNADGRVVTSNPTAQRLLGLSEDQLLGRSTRESGWHFINEDRTLMPVDEYPVARAFETRQPVRDLVIGISGTEADRITWALVNADPVLDDAGAVNQVIVTFMDITERKRAEQEVRQQKDMLENTLESLTYPFLVINAEDYTIELANSAAIGSGDLPENAKCYTLTHQRHSPCDDEEHPCPLQEVIATKEHVKLEHTHYASEGNPRCVEVHGYPIFDAEGDVVQMIEYTIDITERKRAQRSLAEKKDELARSNAELEEFAYIASHDLQEPLRKVQAFGDRLWAMYSDILEERGQDYLSRMQGAVEQMRNLIDDLLAYSRVTRNARQFEAVDLNAVTERVIADLVIRIEETDGRVEVEELPTVAADAMQVRRLLQNLIGNALKFHQKDEPPLVKIYSEETTADDFYQIAVRDNGIGFDRKYAKQIFAPFQRLHGRSEYEGTGMGLAICRKIVERHGGRIWVDSEPGEGTTFHFTLRKSTGGSL